jgi:hypothetical protein
MANAGFPCLPSQTNQRSIEISDGVLKSKLEAYVSYIKEWSVLTKMTSFMIGMEQQKLGDNVVFTFKTFLSPNSIDRFGPSAFTIIDGLPIMLHSGIEAYIKPDLDFNKFLKENYWKDSPVGSIDPVGKINGTINVENSNLSDSVNIIGNGVTKRVPKSSVTSKKTVMRTRNDFLDFSFKQFRPNLNSC